MKRELFEIWEESPADGMAGIFPWRAQLVNYVGTFGTKRQAESFVEAIKRAREQDAKSVVKSTQKGR